MVKDIFISGIQSSDDQHIEDIILLAKGQSKFYPELGANIKQYIKSKESHFMEMRQIVSQNLEYDGAGNHNIIMQDNTLIIQASYGTS